MGHYARVTLTIVTVLVLLAAAWAVRATLMLVLVAAVLAVGLDPPVRRLQRLHISRGWAVVLIFVATVGFMVLFAMLVIPPLVREVRQLASDIPGYREVVRAGVDGLLVPPGDPQALAEAVAMVLADRDLARRLSAASRERADAFRWEVVAERIEAAYRDAIARHS